MIPLCEENKVIMLENKLNKNNTTITNEILKKAKSLVVYYTPDANGNGYIDSTLVPNYPLWNKLTRDGVTGFVQFSKTQGRLIVSPYSDDNFEVIGYSMIM